MALKFLGLFFVTAAWGNWLFRSDRTDFPIISEQLWNQNPNKKITDIWIYKKSNTRRDYMLIRFLNSPYAQELRPKFIQYMLLDSDYDFDFLIRVPSQQILKKILGTIHSLDPFDSATLQFLEARIH